jgi:hypothetical protein
MQFFPEAMGSLNAAVRGSADGQVCLSGRTDVFKKEQVVQAVWQLQLKKHDQQDQMGTILVLLKRYKLCPPLS